MSQNVSQCHNVSLQPMPMPAQAPFLNRQSPFLIASVSHWR